jgi:hypothetical protein
MLAKMKPVGLGASRIAIILAHGQIVWVDEVLEMNAPDAVTSCLSRTGGRLRCNQIISQDCSGFKGIV